MEYSFDYYQNSFISVPAEMPIIDKLSFKEIERIYGYSHKTIPKAYFSSYISEFDCLDETNWWFTIKDNEYDIYSLSSKKRYEITKSRKYCETRRIDSPCINLDEIINCYIESFDGYPELYRPKKFDKSKIKNDFKKIISSKDYRFYVTFLKENNKLIGFSYVHKLGNFVKLVEQKTLPSYEKYNSNAALLDCMLIDWSEELKNHSIIITNGSKTIKHQINFNEYLEKYFGFRKAYSRLRVVYRFPLNLIVPFLKLFIKFFEKSNNHFLYNIYCVLKMDSCKEN